MRFKLLCVGKTTDLHLLALIEEYEKRLSRYINFERIELPAIKSGKKTAIELIKQQEAQRILERLKPEDHLVLLDETGKEYRSKAFAHQLNQYMLQSKDVCFVIGGAYGFDATVYKRASALLSLSKMTFSHQMIRLFFVEQLYRGVSILKGLPYHHE
ncbi:MAG: 23S rRNA (pseudouridine(1915)-N(3))-methyltransferase RlmH [Flavobacteriaceae bacterium]|nr:23S rRNA (pseudouridine(1915)-N(3))-methyltransferase RlmH [Flavobacteriaceae bacterium]